MKKKIKPMESQFILGDCFDILPNAQKKIKEYMWQILLKEYKNGNFDECINSSVICKSHIDKVIDSLEPLIFQGSCNEFCYSSSGFVLYLKPYPSFFKENKETYINYPIVFGFLSRVFSEYIFAFTNKNILVCICNDGIDLDYIIDNYKWELEDIKWFDKLINTNFDFLDKRHQGLIHSNILFNRKIQQESKDLNTFIYFIKGKKELKLGYSGNPEKRIQQHKWLGDTTIIKIIKGTIHQEQKLHSYLRCTGETLSPECYPLCREEEILKILNLHELALTDKMA